MDEVPLFTAVVVFSSDAGVHVSPSQVACKFNAALVMTYVEQQKESDLTAPAWKSSLLTAVPLSFTVPNPSFVSPVP